MHTVEAPPIWLFSGWDSPVLDPKTVKFERNKSLTNEGIDAYWKSKKRDVEEHLGPVSDLEMRKESQDCKDKESETETSLEEFLKKTGWWTRTSSAFLNESPVIAAEGPAYKYASQFHVAASSNSQTGITT
ncbi:uncharacterized protein LOC130786261 isoform X2 [Actinidia eriantha]|uniref:uncharacterized protein LOC130786261 isoform X2 n=1 Tax=Actinidia eriantha TaxID=165200 RepID=UPI002590B986|nr:uncharacterized protein LOC130786261 isoform X2 [Actinidia eriantha]XP_057502522.1 uncharacterized protein LOC130786261 isoform X2 [Actinidia eriantha]